MIGRPGSVTPIIVSSSPVKVGVNVEVFTAEQAARRDSSSSEVIGSMAALSFMKGL
jgi:hypothetical protein